jgi:CRISPR-associated protein Cmr1
MSIRSKLPACPGVPVAPLPSNQRDYDIEIITPLFGGGVSAGVNDADFPIRPTSVRGQLQFWWRATVGAQYETKEQLRAAQSALWGDTSKASSVRIRVQQVRADAAMPCARFDRDRDNPETFRSMPTWQTPFQNTALPYVLFPFQGQLNKNRLEIDRNPASCIHKASFRLTISFDSKINFATDVEPALWAWINFGGLGSRTRRGCGALLCRTMAPKDPQELSAAWHRYMPQLFQVREWPTLGDNLFVRSHEQPGELIPVWNYIIEQFRHFRQGEKLGRNEGQHRNRPGRSRFPEPETIRNVTKMRLGRHGRMHEVPNDGFPRAEFGLPIVFHFQERGDPADTVLYPGTSSNEKAERMASPIVLKPLALQNGKAIPLILRLQTPALTAVDLRKGTESLPLPRTTSIRDPRLATYKNSPLGRSSAGSAIEAFLAFAQEQGFTKVTQ